MSQHFDKILDASDKLMDFKHDKPYEWKELKAMSVKFAGTPAKGESVSSKMEWTQDPKKGLDMTSETELNHREGELAW